MMEGKFFWLKLKRDFFKRHDIRIIEAMENGKEYVLFYLKLLVESIDHEGNLRFSDSMPYTPEMLATITNTDPEITEKAIKTFIDFGLMEVKEDKTYFMSDIESMIGFETEWAKKKRDYRKGQVEDNVRTMSSECPQNVLDVSSKNEDNVLGMSSRCPHDVLDVSSECPHDVLKMSSDKKDNVRQEKEKEIEIELEKDIEREKNKCIDNNNSNTKEREDPDLALAHLPIPKPYEPHYVVAFQNPEATPFEKQKYGEYQHVLLSQNDFQKLVSEHGMDMVGDCIKFLDEYIEQKGYKNNNHYLAINKWVINAVNERKKKKKGSLAFEDERKTDYMALFGQGEW